MTDRIPGAPGRCKAVVTGGELQKMQTGEEFAITLRRDDQPIKEGTPYSKASVLPDELAESLCPGVEDPAPKDAFAALYTQKADTVRRANGRSITLCDAAHTPLMGLKLYGEDTESGTVGDSGSVTVKVQGKNVADVRKFTADAKLDAPTTTPKLSNSYGTTISATSGDSITVTQSEHPNTSNVTSYTNGFFVVGCYCPWKSGDKVTISFNCDIKTNPLNNSNMLLYIDGKSVGVDISVKDAKTGLYYYTHRVLTEQEKENNWHSIEVRVGGKSGVFSNFQIEYGSAFTGYEEYKEPQTLTVPTPGGLLGGDVCDEIDFAKGVLIRRCSEQSETPLSDEVLEAYVKLHTCAPTTVITNDAGAAMEVTYYTSSTAVQMVHSPADKGKTFTIDEHGCVTLTKDNPVIASGETTVDGVKWYYRKWADGFAECWAYVSHKYEPIDQSHNSSTLYILLPFSIVSIDGNAPPHTYIHILADGYEWVRVNNVFESDYDTLGIRVTVPEYATGDEYISYGGDIYIAGYWKTPEVSE